MAAELLYWEHARERGRAASEREKIGKRERGKGGRGSYPLEELRRRHTSLREIDGKHGDTHQCAWLEEEDKMEILQKYP
jgi:hypothetical protein